MRARPASLALCVALCGAVPTWAGDGHATSPRVALESPGVSTSRPLVQSARVFVAPHAAPVDVNVCVDWRCSLYRSYVLEEGQGDSLVIEQHPPFGPVFFGDHFEPGFAVTPSGSSTAHIGHAVALYGAFAQHAPPAATLVSGPPGVASAAGGIEPREATRALDEEPAHALAFSAVVLAPGAFPDEALLASLDRLVRMGGAVALPLSSRDRLSALLGDAALTPLEVDERTRLVEMRSQRVLAEGARELPASVARRDGGAIVVYDDARLGETLVSDALLAAVPRFSASPRLMYDDVRQTPASHAAGLSVARPVRPLLLALPLIVAVLVFGLALRGRRSRGVLVTRASLALAAGATAAFLVVPPLLDDGQRAEVRTYVSWGDATVALEEGAIAERPPSTGGVVAFTGPVGTRVAAEVRGIDSPRPQRMEVDDGGRTVRFRVHGDGLGVASWLRPVELDGLRVSSSDGGWPQHVAELVVENRLPFTLDEVHALFGMVRSQVGPVAPGEKASFVSGPAPEPPEPDGRDPKALARRRLVDNLRARCAAYGYRGEGLSCVFGIGTAPDGALVAVQVLSP